MKFKYYLSFGNKKMTTTIEANSRKEADDKVKQKLVIDKVEPQISDTVDDIFGDIFGMICPNPLHKVEIKLRGFCSRCKGK